MTNSETNLARLLFEKDLNTIRMISMSRIRCQNNFLEGIIIEELRKKGYTILKENLFIGLAIWVYNSFVNYHLYSYAGIWEEYQIAVKNLIHDFCIENDLPLECFQTVESVYHWKSTRKLAANYSAPLSILFKLKTTDYESSKNLEESTTRNSESVEKPSDRLANYTEKGITIIEFDNYWDACIPFESNLFSIGLFLQSPTESDNSIIDKEFINRIENADVQDSYVDIIENNLCRNLIEVFFYSMQDDMRVAKLVFEAMESFIPITFNHRIELIIAPLVAIREFLFNKKSYLFPMSFVKHEFSTNQRIVCDDLIITKNIISTGLRYEGDYSSLFEQWGKWRSLETPSEEVCNLIFSLILGLRGGREADSRYFFKKLSSQNCQSFYEAVLKLKEVCSALDSAVIDTYLEERDERYGTNYYIDESGLLYVSGTPRDINTILHDLDIPTATQPLTDQIEESVQQEPQSEQLSPVDYNQVIPDSLTTEHLDLINEFEIGKKYFTHKKRNYAQPHCDLLNEGFNSMVDEDKANRFERLMKLLARERCIYPSVNVMRSCAYAMTGYGFYNPFKPDPVFWNPERVDVLLYICQRFYNKRGDAKTPMSDFKYPAKVFHVIKEYQGASNRSQSASKVDTDDFGKDFKEIFPEL